MAAVSSPELKPLVTILIREQAVYQDLLEVAEVERMAIVERRLTDLKDALQRKHGVLARLASLEDRRVSWLKRYARKHQLDVNTLTLASIVDSADQPDGRLLSRLHRGLRQRIDRVVEANRITSQLLEGALKTIDASLRYLLADEGAGPTYAAQGALVTSTASRRLFDAQA